ncbi:uncharacterized protein THITE_2047841, partial [Thermothielavioides terrestris NRRL 8126]
ILYSVVIIRLDIAFVATKLSYIYILYASLVYSIRIKAFTRYFRLYPTYYIAIIQIYDTLYRAIL